MALAALKYYKARAGKARVYRFTGLIRAEDPTSTLVLRRRFSADMGRRFRDLKGQIRKRIVDENFFGYEYDASPDVVIAQAGFEYRNASEKLEQFMSWLRDQQDAGVLELVFRPTLGGTQPWTNVYIQSAYQKGIMQTRQQMRATGAQIPSYAAAPGVDEAVAAFNQPFHIDRVGLIYTRTFNELKGVTEAMDQQISRELALGMAEGRNPRQLASMVNKRVDNVGLIRARLIARTEVVHAHNQASLNEMTIVSQQIDENVLVQWYTAQDARVRPSHQDRHGRVYTRGEGEGLIGEPNCRCALLPYITSIQGSPDKASGAARSVINSVLKKQKAAATPGPAPRPGATLREREKLRNDYMGLRNAWDDNGRPKSRLRKMYEAHDKWIAVATDDEVLAHKMELLERMLFIEAKAQPSSALITGLRGKMREGIANWVPADLLMEMEANGYTMKVWADDSAFRAFFNSNAKLCEFGRNSAYDVYGHEFAHAIDDFFSRKEVRGFTKRHGIGLHGRTGLQWHGNRYVNGVDGDDLRASFKSLTSGTKGQYTNGDGFYWKDNWIDNYEGRIYERAGGDKGVEWWSMNGQRYAQYRRAITNYEADVAWLQKQVDENPFVRRGGSSFGPAAKKYRVQSKALEKMKAEGAEAYAARTTAWGRVRKSYPKLAEFIERKFGDTRFVTK